MAEYNIVVEKGVDKSSVMATFSNVTDSLVGSARVFQAEIDDQDLNGYKNNTDISFIEIVNNEVTDD